MSVLEAAAAQLWRVWFKQGGDPLIWDHEQGQMKCFFCGYWNSDHDPDCIYLNAQRILADAKKPETTEFTLHYPDRVRIITRQGGAAELIEVPLGALLKFAFGLPLSVFESMPADLMGDGKVDVSFANAVREKFDNLEVSALRPEDLEGQGYITALAEGE